MRRRAGGRRLGPQHHQRDGRAPRDDARRPRPARRAAGRQARRLHQRLLAHLGRGRPPRGRRDGALLDERRLLGPDGDGAARAPRRDGLRRRRGLGAALPQGGVRRLWREPAQRRAPAVDAERGAGGCSVYCEFVCWCTCLWASSPIRPSYTHSPTQHDTHPLSHQIMALLDKMELLDADEIAACEPPRAAVGGGQGRARRRRPTHDPSPPCHLLTSLTHRFPPGSIAAAQTSPACNSPTARSPATGGARSTRASPTRRS